MGFRIEKISHPLVNLLGLLLLTGFLLLSLFWFFTDAPPADLGDRLEIRGSTYIALRVPTEDSIERIEIHDDGTAARLPIPFNNSRDPWTVISLTQAEVNALKQFRVDWCRNTLILPEPTVDEPFTDVAVDCAGDGIRQRKVPVNNLPDILREILVRLPSLTGRQFNNEQPYQALDYPNPHAYRAKE